MSIYFEQNLIKICQFILSKKINTKTQFKLQNKFVQVTSTIENFFKIICKSCYKLLNYFIAYNYLSTTNIKKHFQFIFFLKRKRSKLQIAIDLIFNRVNYN